MKRLAITYRRVSTDDQAREGVSLDNQLAEIEAFIARKGWELCAEAFQDAGRSGRTRKRRPGLAQALKAVCEAKGVLVVYSLSRLARSSRDAAIIMDELRAAGADLVVLDMDIDTSTAMGEMIFSIMAALAQMESRLTGERIAATHKHLKRTKGYTTMGLKPFGWKVIDGALVELPEEQAVIAHMRTLRRSLTLRAVAAQLNAEGLTHRGRPWNAQAVNAITKSKRRMRVAPDSSGSETAPADRTR